MIQIRRARHDDAPFLWQCLAIAAQEPSVEQAAALPMVAKYLIGWPRPSDIGVVAELDGRPLGAAWARHFSRAEQPFVYVDSATPEIAIGVLPGQRGRGIGRLLLDALAGEAKSHCRGLCLSVRDGNPAVGLYERAGYRRIPGSETVNRTGGTSYGMVLTF